MELLPLVALSALILVKEAGVPVPVPGDLLVIGAGISTTGKPEALVWLVAILVAGDVGGLIQFGLIRGPARGPVLRVLGRFGLSEARLERLGSPLCRRGARAVALARTTPGLRVGAIAASAVVALPTSVFLRGLIAGNALFVGGHFALGFVVGAPARGIGGAIASPTGLAIAVLALAIVGGVGWLMLRRRGADASGSAIAAAVDWADAACPVCLGLAAFGIARDGALAEARAEI